MPLSLRKNGLTSLFKEVRVFKGGVLPYKWEAYCSTNGSCTVRFPFLQGLKARKVQRYKREAYSRTNWGCTAVLSSRPVGFGVAETLLNQSGIHSCRAAEWKYRPKAFWTHLSTLPKAPCRTQYTTESEFRHGEKIRYGRSKTLRRGLRNACLYRQKRQENGIQTVKLRR